MRDVIRLLTQILATQAGRQDRGYEYPDRASSARARDFLTLDPPEFKGTNPNADPQEFIDNMQRTLNVMKASATEYLELATYRLQGIAINWFQSWRLSWGRDALPPTWQEFSDEMEDRVHRYMMGLEPGLQEVCMAVAMQPGSQQQVGSGQEVMPPLRCATCGKRHVGRCRQGVCYTCGDPGHYARVCPQRMGCIVPENSIVASSPSVRAPEIGLQTSSDRGRGRGGASSSSIGSHRIYALGGRPGPEKPQNAPSGLPKGSSVYLIVDILVDLKVVIAIDLNRERRRSKVNVGKEKEEGEGVKNPQRRRDISVFFN
ncbi:uncharacterized protein LOC132624230 [Lycium barbarum]|uniref:uncharacterized protein LOC132624230 n=1 Tax=Lycium barbarum TaxID=112863 RepID=UPI00293F168B|nr:uncharacterized protein LOC132624230 [Lycium barbarum]